VEGEQPLLEEPPGRWFLVPGQWVDGKWVPSHWVWVPTNPESMQQNESKTP
jgi:hypothetical protein